MVSIDCRGQGGGLAFLRKNKEEAVLSTYNINHIDMVITVQGWQNFRFTGLYGEPDRSKQSSTCDFL